MKLYIRLTPNKDRMNSIGWAFWPLLAIREDFKDDKALLEHEEFHLWQQFALGFIFFYILWLYYHWFVGYDRNPFELASNAHEIDPSKNNPYSWWKYRPKIRGLM